MEYTKSQRQIAKRVLEITQSGKTGADFFDAIDESIIKDFTDEMLTDLLFFIPENSFLVLSGGFGKKIAEMIEKIRYRFMSICFLKVEFVLVDHLN